MSDLRREIEAAFPLAPLPDPPIMQAAGDAELGAYFNGRSWRAVEGPVIRGQPKALVRMAPPAFRYYIAGYMLVSIEDPADPDILPSLVASAIAARPADARALTPAQRKAVARFLASHVDDGDLRGGGLLAALQHLSQ